MGIMHKLLKQRDLECQGLIMDLTKSKNKSRKRTYQVQGDNINEDDLVPKLATDDNQFTAEHIVQLCKFLAEKSKRNNVIRKHLPSNPSPGKFKSQMEYQRESNLSQESVEDVNHAAYARLHDNDAVLLHTSNSTAHILADKLVIDSNANEVINQKNFLITNKHRCALEKRDILLKIRSQIFERKRQRQLVEQQIDVWRPW